MLSITAAETKLNTRKYHAKLGCGFNPEGLKDQPNKTPRLATGRFIW